MSNKYNIETKDRPFRLATMKHTFFNPKLYKPFPSKVIF